MHPRVDAAVLGPEFLPARPVVGGVAREGRRNSGSFISAGLQEAIRTQRRPAAGTAGKATTLSSTITSSSTSPMISVSRSSTYLAPSISAWNVGAMNPSSVLDRRPAEDRAVPDVVLPELAGVLVGLGRRAEAHQPLLERCSASAGERLLDHEHGAVPAVAQDVGDADAVIGRPVGALEEEQNRP